ncbi:MAG: Rieske 2Fe-2S domain-containing protein [Acidimicrobiia bacterium]|nr:Rieske 2Fe-2S domain-containing protein [Acidimicrobiia bacterium]
MSSSTIIIIAIVVVVFLAFLMVVTTSRRRDMDRATGRLSRETIQKDRSEETAADVLVGAGGVAKGREIERLARTDVERAGGPLPATTTEAQPPMLPPMDEETLGVTRRQFLNRGIVGAFVLGLSGFGGAVLAFLWPKLSGGFGSKINAGSLDSILGQISANKTPFYSPEGRFYINAYPKEDASKAAKVPALGPVVPGMQQGVVALYQRCVHLGCRVPWCLTSQWFECPCHGSRYDHVGEQKRGPAPRGMDRFVVSVQGGNVYVDTKTVIIGPPIGTNTTGQDAEGPHCNGAQSG